MRKKIYSSRSAYQVVDDDCLPGQVFFISSRAINCFFATAKKPPEYEAEMECGRCKKKKWVPWDKRHFGRDPNHGDVRCSECPSGWDYLNWTGKPRLKDA